MTRRPAAPQRCVAGAAAWQRRTRVSRSSRRQNVSNPYPRGPIGSTYVQYSRVLYSSALLLEVRQQHISAPSDKPRPPARVAVFPWSWPSPLYYTPKERTCPDDLKGEGGGSAGSARNTTNYCKGGLFRSPAALIFPYQQHTFSSTPHLELWWLRMARFPRVSVLSQMDQSPIAEHGVLPITESYPGKGNKSSASPSPTPVLQGLAGRCGGAVIRT